MVAPRIWVRFCRGLNVGHVGKAGSVGIAGPDEGYPVGNEGVRDALVVGGVDPGGPVVLAEEHELFGVEGAERGEGSLAGVGEVIEVGGLVDARGLGGEQAGAEAEVEVAVHGGEDGEDVGVGGGGIGGEDLRSERAEFSVEELVVGGEGLRAVRRGADDGAGEDGDLVGGAAGEDGDGELAAGGEGGGGLLERGSGRRWRARGRG